MMFIALCQYLCFFMACYSLAKPQRHHLYGRRCHRHHHQLHHHHQHHLTQPPQPPPPSPSSPPIVYASPPTHPPALTTTTFTTLQLSHDHCCCHCGHGRTKSCDKQLVSAAVATIVVLSCAMTRSEESDKTKKTPVNE